MPESAQTERLFTVHPRAGMAGVDGAKRHMLISRNGGAVRPGCGCSIIVRLGMVAARVPVSERCMRKGCRERWPTRAHRGD